SGGRVGSCRGTPGKRLPPNVFARPKSGIDASHARTYRLRRRLVDRQVDVESQAARDDRLPGRHREGQKAKGMDDVEGVDFRLSDVVSGPEGSEAVVSAVQGVDQCDRDGVGEVRARAATECSNDPRRVVVAIGESL